MTTPVEVGFIIAVAVNVAALFFGLALIMRD